MPRLSTPGGAAGWPAPPQSCWVPGAGGSHPEYGPMPPA
jgi:hypothetical protein